MTYTPEEFQKRAEEKGLTKWRVHDCLLCGYPCGFLFGKSAYRDPLDPLEVAYDSGCDCVSYGPSIRLCKWDSVAKFFNAQENPETIKKMKEFWGFE